SMSSAEAWPKTRAAFPRTSSSESGFFFCGIRLLPVAIASPSLMKPNDCVETVTGHARKAEPFGHPLAINREVRAGECARSERQDVRPPASLTHPLTVAREHRKICQQEMCQQDRLGFLQMRVPRHRRVGVGFGQFEERALYAAQ